MKVLVSTIRSEKRTNHETPFKRLFSRTLEIRQKERKADGTTFVQVCLMGCMLVKLFVIKKLRGHSIDKYVLN